MHARMKHPVMILPDAMRALHALDKATEVDGLPDVTRKLVHLRASQINGCSVCVDMHSRELRDAGESDARLFAVAAWRDPTLPMPNAPRCLSPKPSPVSAIGRTPCPTRSGTRSRGTTTSRRVRP